MELNPPGLQPPLPIESSHSRRETPKRRATTRDWRSQDVLGQDGSKRSPPNSKAVDKNWSGPRFPPAVVSKPLFSSAKHRVGEQLDSRNNHSSDGEKRSPSIDGSAVGREGRHFTVANVGHNGQIFLRPVVRRDHQRYPQPPVVSPTTPPDTAGRHASAFEEVAPVEVSELSDSLWAPAPLPDPPSPSGMSRSAYSDLRPLPTRHRRALSVSTGKDMTTDPETSDPDVFKIVISKPRNEARSKTAEDLNSKNNPLLRVSIPSWKLGTPRFTLGGTPLIRGSSYAPAEEMGSSHASFLKPSLRENTRNPSHPETFSSRMASFLSSQSQYNPPSWFVPAGDVPPSPMVKSTRQAFMPENLVIEPVMFDALTFKPRCDDQRIVRYSLTTTAITAATPPRLVAEITSPSFLDYDLISDFFLTFRSFLDPADLLRLLIARLRWALSQDEESGMIVKVRTFVAIRHWILNYFVDDFVMDYNLRVIFCDLLNDFSDDLPSSQPQNKVPLKIVGELKKCWRRMCAQYWDGPEFDAELGNHVLITPGGMVGHRDPSLTPSFGEINLPRESFSDAASIPSAGSHGEPRPFKDVSRTGRVDSSSRNGVRPTTPNEVAIRFNRQPTSPTSIMSLDVVSCSFPTKALRMGDPTASISFGPHPVDPSSFYTNTDPIASTPRILTGKRIRPQTPHRRNVSLSDSLREHGSIADKVLRKDAELQLTLPYAGSLVRGNLLPPGQPFVNLDSLANEGNGRQTTVFRSQPKSMRKGKKLAASAMSGQGMRKLVGSVRRALSTKGLGTSHAHGSLIDLTPIGPRGATINRLPGTAVVPQVRHLSPDDLKQTCRIDTLGARIVEDFNQAVREDAAETKSATATTASLAENVENVEYSAAHLDSSFELRSRNDSAIATDSKPIVIVDEIVPPEHPVMTGALPQLNQSVESFANSMGRSHSRNPTPPMTPPSNSKRENTPGRLSSILSQDTYESSSTKDKGPFTPIDAAAIRINDVDDKAVATRDMDQESKPPISLIGQSIHDPLSAYHSQYLRRQSGRSYRSRGSHSHRPWASFHSGLAAQSTIKSFDATTCSESSMLSEIMPPPLKMLRRKPGGDLRGATIAAQFDPLPLRRSYSIGSLTAYSDSFRSSYAPSAFQDSNEFVNVVNSDYAQNSGETFVLGAIVEQPPKQPLSLFSTHSSTPNMRPSFEAEAQRLAQIPDDLDDDGGVESTLLKLEGKYEKRTRSVELPEIPHRDPQSLRADSLSSEDLDQTEERRKHRHLQIAEKEAPDTSPMSERYAVDSPVQVHAPRYSNMSSFLSEDSLETCNSVPQLDVGGLQDEGRSTTHTREWTTHSILEGPDTPVEGLEALVTSSSRCASFEFISKTESLERAMEDTPAVENNEDHSFLDVDSDNNSELSSELSAEMIDECDYFPRPLSTNKVERRTSTRLGEPIEMNSRPGDESSAKLTLAEALRIPPPEMAHASQARGGELWSQKPLPPTPDTTPTAAMSRPGLSSPLSSHSPNRKNNLSEGATEQPTGHLPFILAFDSEILAQQFTLIEKDALIEVDWKDLIEMKWKNSHNDSRSWVDFLRNSDAHGVEVVIARFNIMVKWAISEIVLTQELEERARCIIKFLHIAAHCRKYRNFATMSQITIALTSNEIGRLSETWAMVPFADMQTLSDLETLISPTKNFFNLRAEMEGGANAADTGCIPFVGIYTHDLLFNSQRPSEIASSPTTPPLVNFERCRVTASIVKTLLRLLEASTHYQFQPIEGITERCLWMSALSDDEIRRRSESLE